MSTYCGLERVYKNGCQVSRQHKETNVIGHRQVTPK